MKFWYKDCKNTNIVTDALVSAKFTSKKIETHSIYVLSFSAMGEAPPYKTGHLISPKNPVQRIPGQFVNRTRIFSHKKTYWFNRDFDF